MVVSNQGHDTRTAGSSPTNRGLVLCADDFGLSREIDEAILALIEAGRLTATGCMAAGATLAEDAPRLARLSDSVDIGLHFALTDLAPLGAMPSFAPGGRPQGLASVLARGLTGWIAYAEIKAEIGRQVGRFREVFGRSPDFVDGHQHVHLLPAVRSALLDAFTDGTLDPAVTWVRDCHESFAAIFERGIEVPKALFISTLAMGFAGAARSRGVRVNDGFRGITGFAADHSYRTNFLGFLEGAGDRPLVMCHPAMPGVEACANDPITAARHDEYAYFSGENFPADLAAAGVRLVRMNAADQAKAEA